MKKILLKIIVCIGLVVCAIALFMKVQIYKTYKRLDEVQIVDVSQVKDGTYQGGKKKHF